KGQEDRRPRHGEVGGFAVLAADDQRSGIAGLHTAREGIPTLEAIERGGHGQTVAAHGTAVAVDRVGAQSVDPGLHRYAVDGDEFVADVDGEASGVQCGGVDEIDQNFVVVNVGSQRKERLIVRRESEFVVGVVQAGNVAEANIVEVEIAAG